MMRNMRVATGITIINKNPPIKNMAGGPSSRKVCNNMKNIYAKVINAYFYLIPGGRYLIC